MKNTVMRAIKFLGAFILLALIITCSSTKIASSWKADDAKTKPYHNIMVWGMMPEKDSLMRKQVEVHLVNDLVSKGYHAVSSLEVYKEKAYKKLTAGEILSEFKQTGVDAVVTMVLLKKEKEEKEKDYTRREFSYASFSRSFTLPENVNEEDVKATYLDGILRLNIAKKHITVSKAKKAIEVK